MPIVGTQAGPLVCRSVLVWMSMRFEKLVMSNTAAAWGNGVPGALQRVHGKW